MTRFDPRFWEVPLDPAALEEFFVHEPNESSGGDEKNLRDEAVAQLRIVIETKLTERQKSIVQLYFFEGKTQHEIGEELGIAQQVVSKHLFGVIRKGKRVGGAMSKLRTAAAELGISPSKWV